VGIVARFCREHEVTRENSASLQFQRISTGEIIQNPMEVVASLYGLDFAGCGRVRERTLYGRPR
jgi:hypothetical protein